MRRERKRRGEGVGRVRPGLGQGRESGPAVALRGLLQAGQMGTELGGPFPLTDAAAQWCGAGVSQASWCLLASSVWP